MDDDMSTPTTAAEPKPGRRRLLKALAGAGGVFATGALLPERWTRPVVESIIVPAHAQATGVLAQRYAGSSSDTIVGAPSSGALAQRILNRIIPAASAQNGFFINQVSVCLELSDGTVRFDIYDCKLYPPGFKAAGSAPLSADGSFSGTADLWASVSGTLDPAGGTVNLFTASIPEYPNGVSYPVNVFADAPCVPPQCLS